MKAAYVKSPYQFEIREFEDQTIGDDKIRVKIKACGICGTDLHTAATEAKDWRPLGHEIAGIVEQVGSHVDNVKPGQEIGGESVSGD